MQYSFTLRTIYPYLGDLQSAAWLTLSLSVLAVVLSIALGTVIAVMRRSRRRALRFAGAVYVEVMRNTPLLVILYIVIVHKEKRAEVEARARGLFERVRLSHRIDAYPAELSGGEQQRVAIARALCAQPRLLAFDEPTSALDPETVGEVLAVMRDLAAEGRTMLVVTHEIRFAADVGTRMVFMDGGKVVEDGDPRQMVAAASSERARQFLGRVQH